LPEPTPTRVDDVIDPVEAGGEGRHLRRGRHVADGGVDRGVCDAVEALHHTAFRHEALGDCTPDTAGHAEHSHALPTQPQIHRCLPDACLNWRGLCRRPAVVA